MVRFQHRGQRVFVLTGLHVVYGVAVLLSCRQGAFWCGGRRHDFTQKGRDADFVLFIIREALYPRPRLVVRCTIRGRRLGHVREAGKVVLYILGEESGSLLVGLLARRAGVERIRPRHGPDRRQLRAHVLERVRRRVVLLGLGVVEVGSNF